MSPLGDLLERHAAAGIELRIVPDLSALWQRVIASTLEFSGIRLRNLNPGADTALCEKAFAKHFHFRDVTCVRG